MKTPLKSKLLSFNGVFFSQLLQMKNCSFLIREILMMQTKRGTAFGQTARWYSRFRCSDFRYVVYTVYDYSR